MNICTISDWSERSKQIAKILRNLTPEEKQPYLVSIVLVCSDIWHYIFIAYMFLSRRVAKAGLRCYFSGVGGVGGVGGVKHCV